MKAVIVLGHGSRAAEANDSLYEIVKMLKERADFSVLEPAFMGHCQPDLETSVKKLVEAGVKQIVVMPFFLYNGIHVQEDIPGDISSLQEKYAVEIRFAKNLGPDPRIVDIVLDRIQEVG
ncbi:sirohydrochlorin cobaltochelatase [Metallumcola ferriviriculae]|uniref:Sirohydrochlorin cobaltochelatase n=1 Tax=Metallumcola ferriviriculae TaxID=3039180 RepID=A0AAU0UMK7_9FIRM|nr:sirohydrochlorin cobaltochelatase [Desulfitibacteraceae bacterium MK1]